MLKKHKWNIVFLALISLLLIPSVRQWVQSQLLMKPALDKLEENIHLQDTDWDVQLKGINTSNANLKDFKGKVVFLNFWATWCGPCKAEWPSIEALHQTQKNKMAFVLIVMQDEEKNVREYLSKNQFKTPVYIAQSPISEKLMPTSYPTTLIVSMQGQILKKETSSSDWNNPQVNDFLEQITKK